MSFLSDRNSLIVRARLSSQFLAAAFNLASLPYGVTAIGQVTGYNAADECPPEWAVKESR